MKHYSEEDLLKFACKKLTSEKDRDIEKHLSKCHSCLMTYDFLWMQLGIKSYIEYKKFKTGRNTRTCLSYTELKSYISGQTNSCEEEKIKNHLLICNDCTKKYLKLSQCHRNKNE